MKTTAILSVAASALFCLSASANIAIPEIEIHSQLVHEEVDIKISGDEGEVTGTFKFINTAKEYYDLTFYLPVYAANGESVKDFTPDITLNGKALEVRHLTEKWVESDRSVRSFGELPQLEGQKVHWFIIPNVPQEPSLTSDKQSGKEFVLKIRYTQKLAGEKFIYTPLIPKQKEGHDYGAITITADKPLMLIDEDKHDFEKETHKYIAKPSDKRAIVVQVAKVTPQIP